MNSWIISLLTFIIAISGFYLAYNLRKLDTNKDQHFFIPIPRLRILIRILSFGSLIITILLPILEITLCKDCFSEISPGILVIVVVYLLGIPITFTILLNIKKKPKPIIGAIITAIVLSFSIFIVFVLRNLLSDQQTEVEDLIKAVPFSILNFILFVPMYFLLLRRIQKDGKDKNFNE